MFMVAPDSKSAHKFSATAGNGIQIFWCRESHMHWWSALVEIVRSFNERGSPRLAFASVVLFVLLSLGIVGLALIAGARVLSQGLASLL